MKRILCLILVLSLALSFCLGLTACGDDEEEACHHNDTNGDGKCEECGEKFKEPTPQICAHELVKTAAKAPTFT